MGMPLDDDKAVASAGLSVMSLINLSGIVVGFAILSSWTSSMCPTLIGGMGTGAMETIWSNKIRKAYKFYLVALVLLGKSVFIEAGKHI